MNDELITADLIKIKALTYSPNGVYIRDDGIQSPLYFDSDRILMHPEIMWKLDAAITKTVKQRYPECDLIVCQSPGGMLYAFSCALELDLPVCCVTPSDDGCFGCKIEGDECDGKKAVIIEDVVFTGQKSLNTFNLLCSKNISVLGIVAVFSYEFNANKILKEEHIELTALSDRTSCLQTAANNGMISPMEISRINYFFFRG